MRWAGDVLVVGAGITGTLVARELAANGYHVTLVDSEGFGAAQSNHSHGYIHAGYIYRHGENQLVSELRESNQRWQLLTKELGVTPLQRQAVVAFTNALTARAAASAWATVGLPVAATPEREFPPGLRASEFDAAFSTNEPVFDMTEVLTALSGEMSNVRQLRGHVRALLGSGRVEGADTHIGGRRVELRARHYVLAAGASNARLAEGVTGYRGRALVRRSYMLVVEGPTLEPLSVVMPENDTHGLFMVSRPKADGTHAWLISNFVSFAELPRRRKGGRRFSRDASDEQNFWLMGIVRDLAWLSSEVRHPENEWKIYLAPKAELRTGPGLPEGPSIEDYRLPNAHVLSPTKLTLAPLLAERTVDAVAGAIKKSKARQGGDEDAPDYPELKVRPERWHAPNPMPRDQFFLNRDLHDAVNLLKRHIRGRETSPYRAHV